MVATAVSKTVKIIDKTSTIRTVTLYDNKENFSDYDGGDYIAFHDGTAFRYAYCSSVLYTKSTGDPTSYLICNFIDKNGNIRYMYTQQPDEKEVLYKTITSNVSGATLISQEDNEFGCCVYLVNTKGSNGSNGGNGSSGVITSYDKYNNPVSGRDGSAGAGGGGGSAGISVYASLSVGGSSLNMTLEGMCGAGGGGGGGAGGYSSGTVGAGGYGGVGGIANNVSKAYKIRICNGISIIGGLVRNINSSFSGKNGYAGETGYRNDNDGGTGGASGDGNAGWPGGDGNVSRGGTGGTGGSAGSSRVGSIAGTGTTKVLATANFDSSTNAFSNSIASTGGMVVTKIIGSFPD